MKKGPPLKKPSEKGSNNTLKRRTSDGGNEDKSERMNPFLLRENLKNRKRAPGANVLMEIQSLQHSTENVIPLAPFHRLINEICQEQFEERFRWTSLSIKALQTSAEDYMVGLFEDSYLCSMHCKRVTLLAQDMQLARRIRGTTDPGNR